MAHPNIDERRKFVWERMESNAEVRAGITPGEIVEWADKFACSTSAIRNDIALWWIDAPKDIERNPRKRNGTVDRSVRQIVMERDAYRCRYCNGYRLLGLDHIVPISQGGTHDADNLVACCGSCNSRKGGRTPEQAGMHLISNTPPDGDFRRARGAIPWQPGDEPAEVTIRRQRDAEDALAALPWQALLNISHALAASDAASDPDEAALLAFLNEYAPWAPNGNEG